MAEMLKIDNIKKTFNPGTINEKVALNGVNLSLEEGDFVTVIGGNGAGKSTTLNAIAGVWPVDSGDTPFRVQARQISRTRLSGSYDRHRDDDVDRGKYGDRRQTRTEPRALLGHYEKGARRLP